jgi:hypothetical protein
VTGAVRERRSEPAAGEHLARGPVHLTRPAGAVSIVT